MLPLLPLPLAQGSTESPQNQGFLLGKNSRIKGSCWENTAESRDDQKLMACAAGSAESPHNKGFEQKESGEFPLNEILSHLSIRFRENSVECRRAEILQ